MIFFWAGGRGVVCGDECVISTGLYILTSSLTWYNCEAFSTENFDLIFKWKKIIARNSIKYIFLHITDNSIWTITLSAAYRANMLKKILMIICVKEPKTILPDNMLSAQSNCTTGNALSHMYIWMSVHTLTILQLIYAIVIKIHFSFCIHHQRTLLK